MHEMQTGILWCCLVLQQTAFGLKCYDCARGTGGCGKSFDSKGAGVIEDSAPGPNITCVVCRHSLPLDVERVVFVENRAQQQWQCDRSADGHERRVFYWVSRGQDIYLLLWQRRFMQPQFDQVDELDSRDGYGWTKLATCQVSSLQAPARNINLLLYIRILLNMTAVIGHSQVVLQPRLS
jgi:hypothetical protein